MENVTSPVLRPKQAAPYGGMSIATFWRRVKDDDTFPKPFKIGPNASAIMRADLDAWLASKKSEAMR